jgi:hypothetical protein
MSTRLAPHARRTAADRCRAWADLWASSVTRCFMPVLSTLPVRYTVLQFVSTSIFVNVAAFSCASFVLTAAVMVSSSRFSPAVFPVTAAQPAIGAIWRCVHSGRAPLHGGLPPTFLTGSK